MSSKVLTIMNNIINGGSKVLLKTKSEFISGPRWLQLRFMSYEAMQPKIKRFTGKVAIVTASTEGIGFAIAKRMAMEGAKVVVSSRKQSNVDEAVGKLRELCLDVHGLTCHVGRAEDRQRLFRETIAKYGQLNVLVSNAGTSPAMGGLLDCPDSAWEKIFEINVKAGLSLTKEAVPYLRKAKSSNIIFVSSMAAYDPSPVLGVYSVSKTSLLGLTKLLAKELMEDGIRVNCLAPGYIRTTFSTPLYLDDRVTEARLSSIPMKRIGTTDEVGAVAAFLASDDASYITGETILVSGGWSPRL